MEHDRSSQSSRGTADERLSRLSPDERTEALARLAARRRRSGVVPAIPRRGLSSAPMSFGQQRLWFLHLLEPDAPAYVNSRLYAISGPIDTEALRRAFEEVLRRHEAIRTTCHLVDGQPLQRVEPHRPFDLPVHRFDHLPPGDRHHHVEQLRLDEVRASFDLSRDLMLRARLARLDDDQHVLIVVQHHISSDRWSVANLHRELSALYEAYSHGRPSPLADLPIQYSDFASWQREELQGDALERHLSYWKARLEHAPRGLALPCDRTPPPGPAASGDHMGHSAPAALAARLRTIASASGATPYMLYLTALATLLHRYGAGDDIVVGSPIAGRLRKETEPLIGFFINTLVVRTSVASDPPFTDLLRRVRSTLLADYDHQQLPFERLVSELEGSREPGKNPLFQVMMAYQNTPFEPLRLSGLSVEPLGSGRDLEPFPLNLHLVEGKEALDLTLRYQTVLFSRDRIRQLLGHYRTLLEGIAENPGRRLSELPLLAADEVRWLTAGVNPPLAGSAGEAASLSCVHQLVDEQAARTPDAIAVVDGRSAITYRELEARATLLARRLRTLGVGPETLVGLALDRSVDLIVGVLGILKAGGAFVPLELEAPAARWRHVIADAGLRLVVTVSGLAATLAGSDARAICLDEPEPDDASDGAGPGDLPEATGANAAYVLYTSGSTGLPKGVVVEHRHIAAYVRAATETYRFDEGGAFAMVQPITVDSCLTMLFPALASGGTLHVFSRAVSLDAAALAAATEDRQIDHLKIAPTHLSALLHAAPAPERLLPHKTLVLGGEPLHWSLVSRLAALRPACQVWNHYGPTETTVGVLTWRIDLDGAAGADRPPTVPLGHPFGAFTAHVLDRSGNLLPPGALGELHIGGFTVARGYLNRPDQTAAAFVPDTVSGLPGLRLYRTGDLVRRLADGAIEFVGRRDAQVKVRGFRVEPGEIEAVLSAHDTVGECSVILHETAPDDHRLVAYVAARAGAAVSVDELRAFARAHLPAHMAPSAFVVMRDMPRTPHGKIDRQALPPPDGADLADADRPRVAPRTPTEAAITGIWAEVLGTRAFGVDDDFFDLGGHSLLAMRIVARLRSQLGTTLGLAEFFEGPTVSALAARVDAERRGAPPGPASKGSHGRRDAPALLAPLSFAQEQLWFVDQLEPGDACYIMASAIRLRGTLDVAALGRAFDALVARHAALRTVFPVVDDEPRQRVLDSAHVPLPIVDLRKMPLPEREAEASRRRAAEARQPFDLRKDLPVRISLLRLGARDHLLLVTLHHIVCDGWSWQILWREIGTLYGAFAEGCPSPLEPLPTQYFEYASHQRMALRGERLDAHLAYWKAQLDGMVPLELPADRHRIPGTPRRGGRCATALDGGVVGALRDLGAQERTTLFVTLVAAFQLLLARLTGREDVAVGAPLAIRDSPDLEGVIGLFLNTIVLRARLEGVGSFRDLLARVRRATLEAFEHYALPFGTLVQHLRPERDAGRSPLFRILVNMGVGDAECASLRLTGLEAAVDGPREPHPKYDLTLYLSATETSLTATAVYDRDLFDDARIEELLEQYAGLLRQVAEAPERALADYTLVTRRARAVLPDPTLPIDAVPYPRTVVDDVLAQADEGPDRVAIRSPQACWTYRDLARASMALARRLVSEGLRPGDVVALEGKPSPELVAGLVGVLRAGGVILPLDRRLPEARQSLMAEHGGARWILSAGISEPERWWTRQQRPLHWLDVTEGTSYDAQEPAPEGPLLPPSPDAPAYVVFTSGSTAVPKGIRGLHQGLTHFVTWQRRTFDIGPGDVVAHLTSLSFDVALREIFVALTSGASLCLPPDDDVAASPDVLAWLSAERATVVHVVPSIVRRWLDDLSPGDTGWCPRVAFFAGEPLTQALVGRWRAAFGTGRIVNLYGPSETCLAKAAYEVPREPRAGVQPLGQALPDAQLLIVNGAGHLCGIGEPGEIVIRTPFGTGGYLPSVPRQEHQRFQVNPFRAAPGDVVYRSGDRGRYAIDGGVEILGRLDAQLKVRGVRLEPGEIEAVLESHDAVAAAAVVVGSDPGGRDWLVAYVVGSDVSPDVLRSHVARFVPRAVVPDRFVKVEALPLTASGKVDRRRLPEPAPDRPALGTRFVEPRTPVEKAIAEIWEEVLELTPVGVHDNFFDLGGHSLMATRVVARLRARFGTALPLVEFFEAPTVAALAVRLDAPEATRPAAEAVTDLTAGPADRPGRGSPLRDLSDICRDALWLTSLDPDDDLADLGCHSLSAAFIRARVLERFGVEIPFDRLLRSCTVAQLADCVAGATPAPVIIERQALAAANMRSTLSGSQQAIWFKQQIWPGAPLFNEPFTIYFGSAVDARALASALDQLVARHQILRTAVVVADDGPRLQVHERAHLSLDVVHLEAMPAPEREARALALAEADARRAFDLSAAPLVRATLVRLGPTDDRLHLTCHHLVMDAFAFYRVFVPELWTFYAKACGRPAPPLPHLPVQFAECVERVAGLGTGPRHERDREFWNRYLHGATPIAFPPGRPRDRLRAAQGAFERLTIDAGLTAALKRLSRDCQGTLFTTLLGAFTLLLARHTRQRDITVATVDAGRAQAGFERVLGCLANVVPVRVDLDGDPTAREVVGRVTKSALEVYDHASGLVLAQPRLLDVAFVMEPSQPLYDDGWRVSQLDVSTGVSKFDLLIQLEEEAGALVGKVEYATDLFDAATIGRLAREFQALLGAMVDSPDEPASRLPLTARPAAVPAPRRQASTVASPEATQCLHERFEQVAARAPDAIAATFEHQSITYGALNSRADRLARELQSRGVRPGVLVGLCLERGLDLVVAILGILKAGGAYVPIDPAYPADRMSFILRDAMVPLVLTQSSLADRVSADALQTLCLDTWEPGSTTGAGCAWGRSDDLAYVIYTSGTTGRPKGTLVTHRNVVRLFDATEAWFGFDDRDVWTLFHSVAFDFSVWELWGALLYGGRLVIVPREVGRSPDEFRALLAREGVSVLNQTPSALRGLIDVDAAEPPGQQLALRYIILGGEALQMAMLRPWFARYGDQHPRVVNMYGITETTVHVTYRPVGAGDLEGPSFVGRPIPDLDVYLLGEHQEPVPEGVIGEIYVGGAGVARGYLNLPDLTRERFVTLSLDGQPPRRFYRSGDLARRHPNGDLEFLGRADHQVKVRGHRVELGEIETALARHPGVGASVVTTREARPGDTRLVAYVVGRHGDVPPRNDLVGHLRAVLPEYMIPTTFVPLGALPLTENGKIDRRALPEPPGIDRAPDTDVAEPRTREEEALARIWADVLGVDRVGIHDDFFRMGGHSLLVVAATTRARKALSIDVSFRDMFEAPTVAQLAARLAARSATRTGPPADQPVAERAPHSSPEAAGVSAGGLRPAPCGPRHSTRVGPGLEVGPGTAATAPLSFAQQRLWFLWQLEPDSPAYNISNAWRVRGPLDAGALRTALQSVVERHAVLRTTFTMLDDEPRQIVHGAGRVELPVVDVSAHAPADREEEAGRVVAAAAARPFDLEGQRPFRASLVRLGADDHVLLVSLHHIAGDGWSSGLLWREIGTFYGAHASGRPAALPPLPWQYTDFAVWQRGHLTGTRLATQLEHWRGRLQGLLPLGLPTDEPRPARPSFRGARHGFVLDADLAAALRSVGRRQEATPFMTTIAAFQLLLARYAGQEDVAVGTPIANRVRPEIEPLIGFFVNTLVIRTTLAGDPSFRELLARVRETALDAFDHQELPFEKLVEELRPERDLGRNPLVQVLLAHQGPERTAPALQGLDVGAFPVRRENVRFDLELHVSDARDGRLRGTFIYKTDLFHASTIARLAQQFETLLRETVRAPEVPVSRLHWLRAEDRHELLFARQRTAALPADPSIHRLVEAQVERTPATCAVVDGDRTTTYAEVNARANQVARGLQHCGVLRGDRVAVCLERSTDLLVAVLAALKAGAAYVPLDPAHPDARLACLLAESAPRVIVTSGSLRRRLPASGTEIVCLDVRPDPWGALSDANLDVSSASDDLAYVLFTSGSTGRPKGVAMGHGALANLLAWHRAHERLGTTGRTLQFAPLTFDVSFQEIFSTWSTGGAVVLVPEDVRRDPLALLRHIAVNRVQRLFVPYVALRQLAEAAAGQSGSPCVLKDIVSAGETLLLPQEVRRFVASQPDCRLHNHYGPTETHVVTAFTLPADTANWPDACPIGQPLPNARVYVLDTRMEPVPIGVTGEIYVGGACLSQGYLNQPGLTAERFVANPHVAGDRLYRTGDLARWRDSGQLEFLGRKDWQVKIRGYRVELEEIEAVLGNHPEVRCCAVAVREDRPGDQRLVAYIEGDAPPRHDLLRHLRTHLPDYMVPATFVPLPALPLTPNGKVDRGALPVPPRTQTSLARDGTPPRTPLEQVVADVWAEVLGLDQVDVDDNFFDLGGHSIAATRVIARLRATLDPDLPLRLLFQAPTVAQFAEHLAGAPPQKPIDPADSGAVEPAFPGVAGQTAPLSFPQQRLWFLHQLDPDCAAYNMSQGLRLQGGLDVAALNDALERVVRRHATLRTVFVVVDGEPRQRILPPAPFALPVIDLASLTEGAQEQAVAERAAAEARRPFDLSVDAPLRATLLRLSADEHVLLLTLHHIAADGWSLGILWREVAALYEAARSHQTARLPALPIQYADAAAQQRAQLQGERLERLLTYWRGALDGLVPLELPTDRPRPPRPSYRGGVHRFQLAPEIVAGLRGVARTERATLFMALLAAFQVLLARHADQDDVAVATPFAGREQPEIEPLIGFFVNTLVLRTRLDGHPSFRELLRRVRQTTLDAHDHQELPFERLVEELQPVRDPARNPLAQVVIALQNAADTAPGLPGVETRALSLHAPRVRFDLELHLREAGEGAVTGTFLYATDLFDAHTIEDLARRFTVLLDGLVAQPETPVTRIPLVTEEERTKVIVAWNATTRPLPDEPVHRLFETQAARTPDAVALAWRSGQLTYAELNERANRLARHLVRAGVSRDDVVGVAIERSADAIVALLGVLKAGGAYLPLDLRNPSARQRRVLEDSGTRLLVTDGSFGDSGGTAIEHIVYPDRDAARVAREPASNLDHHVPPDALAYLMYTSGSTGRPKGVEIPHRAVVRLAYADVVPLAPGDTVLQLAPLSFDASTFEVWAPLLRGARVVLYPDRALDLPVLEDVLQRERVTHLWLTSSLFNAVVDGRPQALRGLTWLLAGGEALSVPHVARALDACPSLRMLNGYGPTEVTTFSCVHPIERQDLAGTTSIPIGRPIANTTAYVLDRHLQPVPIGVPGDLYLGGEGLARGYRHEPVLTAERFLANPFVPGDRLYRTGDRVRYRAEGALEFLGRRDDQIKLRGFRIELGEVEGALGQHPAVKACAVTVMEHEAAGRRLVAYVVPREGAEVDAVGVARFLRERLPEEMVPAVFVPLPVLPLTPSGKVDRRALPAPTDDRDIGGRTYVAPRTTVEATLAGVWAKVLGRSQVGIHDNFFELGGHSLLATRVIARLRELFAPNLPLRLLFEAPTVARLAERLSTETAARHPGTPAAVISSRTAGDTAPLSFAQQRLWFLHQLTPTSAAYNLAQALHLRGALDIDALQHALEYVVARHAPLRTTFEVVDGEPRQRIQPPGPLPPPIVDLTDVPGPERDQAVAERARVEAGLPFDLARHLPLRAQLLRLADAEHVLLLTMHHIATDGWSQGIFWRELNAVYAAARAGEAADLPPLAVQYADYAIWQRERLEGQAAEHHLAFWRAQLEGLAPLDLPADRARPPRPSHRGAAHRFELSAEIVKPLRALARTEGTTLFVALLACCQVLLARYAGRQDVAVATPFANRERREIEALIGFFVNTLVLRTRLDGPLTFRALLGRVHRTVLDAQEHQDLPFERLVEALHPARDLSRNPLAQVVVALQNASDSGPRLPGLDVRALPAGPPRVRFDLEVHLRETGRDAVAATMLYATDLFEEQTIEGMARHFEALLAGLVAQPDAPMTMNMGQAIASQPIAGDPMGGGLPGPTVAAASHRPLSATETALAAVWCELLGVTRVAPDDTFFQLGGHSLLAVRLLSRIERDFGRQVPMSILFTHGTLAELAQLLDGTVEAEPWSPLVPIQVGGSRPPLFLVHGIGGEVAGFRAFAHHLGGDQPLYGLQAAGPGAGDAPRGEVVDLASHYSDLILETWPAGPCFVTGYSAGGPMALEVAQQLRARGKRVALLVLLDAGLPRLPDSNGQPPHRLTPLALGRHLLYWFTDDARTAGVRDLATRTKVKLRMAKARAWRWLGLAREGPDLLDMLGLHRAPESYREYIRERYEAFRRYQPRPYAGRVALVRGRARPLLKPRGPEEQWKQVAAGGLDVQLVRGNHVNVLNEPYVAELARAVRACLDRALEEEETRTR